MHPSRKRPARNARVATWARTWGHDGVSSCWGCEYVRLWGCCLRKNKRNPLWSHLWGGRSVGGAPAVSHRGDRFNFSSSAALRPPSAVSHPRRRSACVRARLRSGRKRKGVWRNGVSVSVCVRLRVGACLVVVRLSGGVNNVVNGLLSRPRVFPQI